MGKQQNKKGKKKSYEKPKVKSQKIEMGVYGDYNEDNDGPPLMPINPKTVRKDFHLDS